MNDQDPTLVEDSADATYVRDYVDPRRMTLDLGIHIDSRTGLGALSQYEADGSYRISVLSLTSGDTARGTVNIYASVDQMARLRDLLDRHIDAVREYQTVRKQEPPPVAGGWDDPLIALGLDEEDALPAYPAKAGLVQPKIDGRPFRCNCGANVFQKTGGRYTCNACGTEYEGTPAAEQRALGVDDVCRARSGVGREGA